MNRKRNRAFVGNRDIYDGCTVSFDGHPLPPRHDVRNHSPTGFEWGYEGSGPSQLALAMLCALVPVEVATKYYREFKSDRIANIESCTFCIHEDEVLEWLRQKGAM